MRLNTELAVAFVASGLIPAVVGGSYIVPDWPHPPGGSSRTYSPPNLTADVGYAVYNGVHNSSSKLNIWKGIRYAAAPVGDLRWRAPVKPATTRTVTPADAFGSACPAVLPAGAPFLPGGSEDCLFLNVWAPDDAEDLPVLIWIHGGGYGLGDGTQDMTEFINDNANSIVVLGAFGFLSPEEVHSDGVVNAGILDQAFAFSWVQSYISVFGGDPSRVSISGESAGGGSVMYHAIAANGTLGNVLFKNLIASSPYLVNQQPYNEPIPTSRYLAFANASGCLAGNPADSPSSYTTGILACLRSQSTATLQAANFAVGQLAAPGYWYFTPVTDYTYIASLPSAALAPGRPTNGLRLLVGNNAHEGDLFVPPTMATEADLRAWLAVEFPALSAAELNSVLAEYPLTPDYPTQQQRADNIYAESQFVCPSYFLADAFAPPASPPRYPPIIPKEETKKRAWHYQYSVPYASHGTDLSAIFGPATPKQAAGVVTALRRAWGTFVREGQPGCGYPTWAVGTGAKLTDFDQSGGVPEEVQASWGVNVTQFLGPGLKAEIKVVDAWTWETGRGARCEFWRGLGAEILQ